MYVKAMRKQYNLTKVELSEKSEIGLRSVAADVLSSAVFLNIRIFRFAFFAKQHVVNEGFTPDGLIKLDRYAE